MHVSGPASRTLAAYMEGLDANRRAVPDPARSEGTVEMADADVEGYLLLHSGFARGETRSLLMPWPELRTLAR